MKIKTSEITGAALDWAVAKILGVKTQTCGVGKYQYLAYIPKGKRSFYKYTPSSNWKQGGPLMEQHRIRIDCPWDSGPFEATCKIDGTTGWVKGPTILIAAMRCLVSAKLGDEVEVPDELG